MSAVSSSNLVLLEGVHASGIQALENWGHQVRHFKDSYLDQSLIDLLIQEEVHALGIRSKTQLTQEVFKRALSLQVVGAFCIGTNQIDLEAAASRGIPVFNAPYSNTRSVAELVICEVIALSRKITKTTLEIQKGVWNKSAKGSFEVRGKTIGVVGYGHIGTQVGILAESMGLNVLYYDVVPKLPLGNASACTSFEELLEKSDFVTLHVPETVHTKNMLDKKQMQKMKRGSFLINASRGSVLNLKALAQFLKEEHIAGAAIDVYPEEPNKNGQGFVTELQGMENVILTPHIGGSTEEAQKAIGEEVSLSLHKYIALGDTTTAVNFPRVSVPPIAPECIRLIHIHKNIPGVLGEVNSLFSKRALNISYQTLSTKGELGYLVVDFVHKDFSKEEMQRFVNDLKEKEFTIRVRTL